MPVEWRIGDRIYGRWAVRQILAGGMGQVYVVFDQELRAVLAAKTFKDALQARSGGLGRQFRREVYTWLNLDPHPNVTRAWFVERVEGKLFLFLEHVGGGSLRDWIGTPRLTQDLPEVLRLAVQFCDGMVHLRERGVEAHQDIKPSNCLLTPDRNLKISDFGLAVALDGRLAEASPGTAAAKLNPGGGTWAYMAPERFEPPYPADVRGDVYSFGVMLYSMLAGRLPFVARTRPDWAARHRRYAPPELSAANLPESLRRLVRVCLAKSPEERYEGFAQLRQALATIHHELTGEPPRSMAAGLKVDESDWTHRGASLALLGRHEEALTCYERALALDPRLVLALSHQGVSLAALGHHADALRSFKRALRLERDHVPAWLPRGLSLTAQGRPEMGLRCHRVALYRNPRNAAAWLGQGITLAALQRRSEALASCGRAIEINPWSAAAWTQRGRVQLADGEPAAAAWTCLQALERDPWHAPAWCTRGIALDVLGRHEEAVECLSEALVMDPRHVATWVHRGVALAALGSHQRALWMYRRALRLEPRCLAAWIDRSRSLSAGHRFGEALECCDCALALDQRCVSAWLHRVVILKRLGRLVDALHSCNHALRLDRKSGAAWYIRAQLKGPGALDRRQADECIRRAWALGFRVLRRGPDTLNNQPNHPLYCIEPYLRPCDCRARPIGSQPIPTTVPTVPEQESKTARSRGKHRVR
ncbi:MAG: serine/threonine-protein kinase [Candidatus Latescibacterota bacterium]